MKKYSLYAIGEILLVVIGILIALQVNNWNENRKNHIQEQHILKALKQEINDNLNQLNEKINSVEGDLKIDSLILVNISNPDRPISENEFSNLVDKLTRPATFDPVDGVLKDIIYSGKINIIRNDELRMNLTSWEGNFEDSKGLENAYINHIHTVIRPILASQYSLRNIETYQKVFGKSKFNFSTNNLLQNREFENQVLRTWEFLIAQKSKYSILKNKLEKMKGLIDLQME